MNSAAYPSPNMVELWASILLYLVFLPTMICKSHRLGVSFAENVATNVPFRATWLLSVSMNVFAGILFLGGLPGTQSLPIYLGNGFAMVLVAAGIAVFGFDDMSHTLIRGNQALRLPRRGWLMLSVAFALFVPSFLFV